MHFIKWNIVSKKNEKAEKIGFFKIESYKKFIFAYSFVFLQNSR